MLYDVPPALLSAAAATLRRLGQDGFSLAAVADAAGMPADDVFGFLGNRESAMKVALDHLGESYFRALQGITDHEDTLVGAVAEGCVECCAHRRRSDQIRQSSAGSSLVVQLLANFGGDVMERAVAFWTPRVRSAQAAGEISADLEARQVAEWIIRVMMSFELLPPIGVDLEDPETVRRYVTRFVVDGLGASGRQA